MLVKLLATLAMAAATWLFWRLIAKVTAPPAPPQARPRPDARPPAADDPDPTITMVQDPETGAWRPEDNDN
jgi:hypothetical protein